MSCVVCKKETKNRCSVCKKAYYCSKYCQKKDWASHKNVCRNKLTENTIFDSCISKNMFDMLSTRYNTNGKTFIRDVSKDDIGVDGVFVENEYVRFIFMNCKLGKDNTIVNTHSNKSVIHVMYDAKSDISCIQYVFNINGKERRVCQIPGIKVVYIQNIMSFISAIKSKSELPGTKYEVSLEPCHIHHKNCTQAFWKGNVIFSELKK